jgi:hypothetical protein
VVTVILGEGMRDEVERGTIVWQSSSVWMDDQVDAALIEDDEVSAILKALEMALQ